MRMNVMLVNVGADDKGVFAFCQRHSEFIAESVSQFDSFFVAQGLLAQLIGEVGTPPVLLRQLFHQLAHGEALPDNVGFDFVPDIHKNYISSNNFVRHSA